MQNPIIKTWNKAHTCKGWKIFYPQTAEELRQAVRQCYQQNKKIRAIGSMSSCTDIAMVDESTALVAFDNMKQIAIDETNQIVQIQAGVCVGELGKILKQHQLRLPSHMPDFDFYNVVASCCSQSFTSSSAGTESATSGAVGEDVAASSASVASSSTSSPRGSENEISPYLNSSCVEFYYVNYDENATLGMVTRDQIEELKYWRSSFGNSGIIYQASLQVKPYIDSSNYNVMHVQHVSIPNWSVFKERFNQIRTQGDQFFCIMDPYKLQDPIYLQTRNWINRQSVPQEEKLKSKLKQLQTQIQQMQVKQQSEMKQQQLQRVNLLLTDKRNTSHVNKYKNVFPWGIRITVPYLKTIMRNDNITRAISTLSTLPEFYIDQNDIPFPFLTKKTKGLYKHMQLIEIAFDLDHFFAAYEEISQTLTRYQWKLKGGILLQYIKKDTQSLLSRSWDQDVVSVTIFHATWKDVVFQNIRDSLLKTLIVKHGGRVHLSMTSGLNVGLDYHPLQNYNRQILEKWISKMNLALLNPFFSALVESIKTMLAAPVVSDSTNQQVTTEPQPPNPTTAAEIIHALSLEEDTTISGTHVPHSPATKVEPTFSKKEEKQPVQMPPQTQIEQTQTQTQTQTVPSEQTLIFTISTSVIQQREVV